MHLVDATLTEIKPFGARLAKMIFLAVVARLALLVTQLTLACFGVAEFPQGTLSNAVCKLQEIRRLATGANVCLAKAATALFQAAFACAVVVIKTGATFRHAPLGMIWALTFYTGIFSMTAVI